MDLFSRLASYFEFPFVRFAFIVGILIALTSSFLGVILVLKRFSHIGNGLSHTAFLTMAVAGVVGLTNEIYITLPVTVACSILLILLGKKSKISGDALIGMLSVGALAIGYLLYTRFSKSTNQSGDICKFLFGEASILTLTEAKVWICFALTIVVTGIFIVFYNRIYAITFDEAFASATGTNSKAWDILIAAVTGITIVLAMNLVGTLLISALIIFPAVSVMRVFKTFKSVLISAAIFSVIASALGLIISMLAKTPAGSTIVAIDITGFFIFLGLGYILRRA